MTPHTIAISEEQLNAMLGRIQAKFPELNTAQMRIAYGTFLSINTVVTARGQFRAEPLIVFSMGGPVGHLHEFFEPYAQCILRAAGNAMRGLQAELDYSEARTNELITALYHEITALQKADYTARNETVTDEQAAQVDLTDVMRMMREGPKSGPKSKDGQA